MQKLNLIIIGGGMFVSGQSNDDFGTILPSVLQAKKNNLVNDITICCKSLKTAKKNIKKYKKIIKLLNLKSNIEVFPQNKDDPNGYLKILKKKNLIAQLLVFQIIYIIRYAKMCLVIKFIA